MHAMIIVIYVSCLNYLGYHICNKQKKLGTFAVCKYHGTRQRNQPLPCARHRWHTANVPRHVKQPCKKVYGQSGHTAKPLPCARYIAHGKRPFANGCLPCALCRVRHTANLLPWTFGVLSCAPWHTTKGLSPVVNLASPDVMGHLLSVNHCQT